jgi:hypothetical protein
MRRHLLVAASIMAVAGAGGATAWVLLPEDLDPRPPSGLGAEADHVIALIAGHFHYLAVPDETLFAFMGRHLEFRRPMPDSRKARSELYVRFLMSTDFFINDEDAARPLHFLAYYDPYRTPCFNPLVRRG